LLLAVTNTALIGELVRRGALSEQGAWVLIALLWAAFGGLLSLMWRIFLIRGPHPQPHSH
jgi:hypothetical protein